MKTMIITGAASGIGKACAEKMHAEGWFLGLFDLVQNPLQRLVDGWDEGSYYTRVVDVREPQTVQLAIEAFIHQAGQLDVLFNCAGILEFGDFDKVSLEKHHQIVDVNSKGIINCSYKALPYLKTNPGSRVINMSSASTFYGVPGLASYAASKSWVKSFTESLNIEWAAYQIHVMDIVAPFVNTPMLTADPHQMMDKTGVDLTPNDIAEVLFKALSSDKIHLQANLKLRIQELMGGLLSTRLKRLLARHYTGY